MTKLQLIKELNLTPVKYSKPPFSWMLEGNGTLVKKRKTLSKDIIKKISGGFTVSSGWDYIYKDTVFNVNPKNGNLVIKNS